MGSPAVSADPLEVELEATDGSPLRLLGLETTQKLRVMAALSWTGRRLARRARTLSDAIQEASELRPDSALFAVEGIALHWADRQVTQAQGSVDFLRSLPLTHRRDELLMLHAGVGLSIARRLLASLPRRPAPAQVESALMRFVSLCEQSCQPLYLAPALEALGLVAQHFHTGKVEVISAAVGQNNPLADLFWHGVGRSPYFDLANLLPGRGSLHRALTKLRRLTRDERCQSCAEAGLAWAVAMVCLPYPALVARQLLAAEDLGADHVNLRQGLGVVQWVRRASPQGRLLVAALRGLGLPDSARNQRWRRLVEVADGDPDLLSHPAVGQGSELLGIFASPPEERAPFPIRRPGSSPAEAGL